MDRVLVGLQWEICLVYLDDIIVLGRDTMQMLELPCVLQALGSPLKTTIQTIQMLPVQGASHLFGTHCVFKGHNH